MHGVVSHDTENKQQIERKKQHRWEEEEEGERAGVLSKCCFLITEIMDDSHFNSSYFWCPVPTVQGQVEAILLLEHSLIHMVTPGGHVML